MTPSDNCTVRIDDARGVVVMTDGRFEQRFDLVCRGPGVGAGIGSVIFTSASGAWEISYEITTGRVIDIADTAMPAVDELAPAGVEVIDG